MCGGGERMTAEVFGYRHDPLAGWLDLANNQYAATGLNCYHRIPRRTPVRSRLAELGCRR